MKKIFILLVVSLASLTIQAQIYFLGQVRKSVAGTSLEFYIKPNLAGGDITLKFDNIDMLIRWPSADIAPITGTPVVNVTDFPGLTIAQDPYGIEGYGSEPGFKIRQFASPVGGVTNTVKTYVAGQEYLVFSIPVSNTISNNIELAANNEDGVPYYFSITKNTAGIGGQSDHTSHNSTNGNINNQLFYGTPAQLSRASQNFYQKINVGVVPVKFTAFDLIKKDNDALITWSVENETSITDRYEIERSVDGITFEKIMTLPKLTNGNSGNVYISHDKNISKIKSNGIIYYRIKQIDFNGQFVYTEIKNIRQSEKIKVITAYPNPVRDVITVEIDSPTQQDIVMNLINTDGKILQTFTMKANKGINIEKISMSSYSTGSYLLKVIMAGEVHTIKIIKQ